MIDQRKLQFWLQHRLNVLIEGEKGVGKTAIILQAFEEAGLKYAYFSAATLDPFIDFVGIPVKIDIKDDDGNIVSHIDLIRPKHLAGGDIQVIFLDEFNRCLTGDTRIMLTDGGRPAIKDLVGVDSFDVYSYDNLTKKIVTARGHSARITQKAQKLLKIVLSNGKYIRCTPDHPFLLSNGSYVNAENLAIGDVELMSLHLRMAPHSKQVKQYVGWSFVDSRYNDEDVNCTAYNNHTISAIETENAVEDVYDITVDGTHNFALDAGVFVHNSHKKVRNAVMELIQFGTINSVPLSKDWYGVWAAINPDSDDGIGAYDTDRLDQAQRDRFQIQVKLPYECSVDFFTKKYGDRNGKAAITYWDGLPPPVKIQVSPRRLDYAMEHWRNNGDVRDVLPEVSLPKKLTDILSAGPAGAHLQSLMDSNNQDEAKKIMADEDKYKTYIHSILDNKKFIQFFVPMMPNEKISSLYASNRDVRNAVALNLKSHSSNGTKSPFLDPLTEIAKADQNKTWGAKIRTLLDDVGVVVSPTGIEEFVSKNIAIGYSKDLEDMSGEPMNQTYYRTKAYERIQQCLPEKLSDKECYHVLHVLDKICHSYSDNLRKNMPKLIAMANHVICCLLRNGNKVDDIENNYKQLASLRGYSQKESAPTIRDLDKYVREKKQ